MEIAIWIIVGLLFLILIIIGSILQAIYNLEITIVEQTNEFKNE